MKKETAVEWLISELMKSKDYQRVINDVNHSGTEEKDIIKQAIAMEKEQIIKFANDYLDDDENFTPEQYYYETYGK